MRSPSRCPIPFEVKRVLQRGEAERSYALNGVGRTVPTWSGAGERAAAACAILRAALLPLGEHYEEITDGPVELQ
ncbi:hypothetical protein NDU88_006847 [Pleurodeles waltl]|uniref:Uncharacterized protein n=1 Tax=Pleurodeles waltl TaxID=8319 RepID=A0AAV7UMR4_PLEWA|nr:hypothetical protein NDU88_006847 [Pleurodeles waltl]